MAIRRGAEELAKQFNSAMQELRDGLFTEVEGMDLTRGRFVTYWRIT